MIYGFIHNVIIYNTPFTQVRDIFLYYSFVLFHKAKLCVLVNMQETILLLPTMITQYFIPLLKQCTNY